jgi:hypothetical protein|eukprot:COSAG06_NODE_1825_length_8282_cov_7.225590_5_plen_78_part_00
MVDKYIHVAKGKECQNLETFLKRLGEPDQKQKAQNRVLYGREAFPTDMVEKFRGFGCVGCGEFGHLFINRSYLAGSY